MATTTISRSEKSFKNASDFNPYRWIKGETEEQIHPYSHLPFGSYLFYY
jgi:cytochrome P450